jgi:autotransporter-associated beta strand protein
LTKQNTGTLILTGANTYSGGTTVSAGVLQGTTTSLQGNILNNASVVFDQSTTGTYAGIMSGTGSLTKQNTGTVILTGTNTYSGGTTVSAGVLQGTTTSLQGNILHNASVVFDQTTSGTYAGVMSGSGSLTKQNTGTLILTGTNTYSGGTTVSGGTLALTSDANIGSGGLDLSNSTTLQANGTSTLNTNPIVITGTVNFDSNGNTFDIGSGISGSGSLNKIGTGTLSLSAAETYQGNTTVSAGRLSVNGTLSPMAGSTVTVFFRSYFRRYRDYPCSRHHKRNYSTGQFYRDVDDNFTSHL